MKNKTSFGKKIPIQVSGRHIHLSEKDSDKLFGKNYKFKKLKDLWQPGEYATKEVLKIESKNGRSLNCRVLLPFRDQTQVELSKTDAVFLRIKTPVRDSGDLEGSPGTTLIGPKGKIKIRKGVINNWRHIHYSFDEAKKIGLKHKMLVSVKVGGLCALTFHNVRVQLGKNCKACLHLDTDEGNAANLEKQGKGEIIL